MMEEALGGMAGERTRQSARPPGRSDRRADVGRAANDTKLYVTLANSLARDIGAGRYAVGAMLPKELELAERFGVSRQTVREAMRRLTGLGLIVRRQGIGTVVTASTPRQVHSDLALTTVAETYQHAGNLLRFDRDAVFEVLDSSEVEAGDAASLLRCAPARRWIRVTGIRRPQLGEPAVSFHEVFLPSHYGAVAGEVGRAGTFVYQLLEARYDVRISEIEQDIRATGCDRPVAEQLGVAAGAPVLASSRHYMTEGGELVLVTVAVGVADRFAYRLLLRTSRDP
jgi:DNA-binding GntR family transcriptional regulator